MTYDTHDLGRLFVHWLPHILSRSPVTVDHSWEVEHPYRFSRSLVFRLWPLNVGFVVGWWQDSDVEDMDQEFEETVDSAEETADFAAYTAVNGTVDKRQWSQARRRIAGLGLEPEEEMAAMQMAGVFGGEE